MDLVAKLPALEDAALASLHNNAERLEQSGRPNWQTAARPSSPRRLPNARRPGPPRSAALKSRPAFRPDRTPGAAASWWPCGRSSHLEPREARHDGVSTIKCHHHRVLRHRRSPCGDHCPRGGGVLATRAQRTGNSRLGLGLPFRALSRRFACRERPRDVRGRTMFFIPSTSPGSGTRLGNRGIKIRGPTGTGSSRSARGARSWSADTLICAVPLCPRRNWPER